jgi:hypothetical protein
MAREQDSYSGGRRDKRRMQTTIRDREQREEAERFHSMSMMQKSEPNGSMSAVKAALADFNARIAVLEADVAQLPESKSTGKADIFARILAALALIAAAGAVALELVFRAHLAG